MTTKFYCSHSLQLTRSEFEESLSRIVTFLSETQIGPESLISLNLPTPLNLMFMEACQYLGIKTSDLRATLSSGALIPDLIISNSPEDKVFSNRFIHVNTQLMRVLDSQESGELVARESRSEFPVRIVFSSGTTGKPKGIAFTEKMLEERHINGYERWMSQGPVISLLGISSSSGFQTYFGAVKRKETYFAPGSPEENFELIRAHEIRSLLGSPVQISKLVDVAISRQESLPSLIEIQSAGSILPTHLARLAERFLGGKVRTLYGSAEVGTIAARDQISEDPFYMGMVYPTVDLEIVNEQDEVLPFGEEGIVRYRKEGMATEYYMNPEATKLAFKDGWFYPGDKGRLDSERGLYLAGRVSESFNSGGVKIDPIRIDNFAIESQGVLDAAAFTFEDERAVQRIALAVVSDEGFDVIAFISKLKSTFGEAHPQVVFQINEIPRNETGKVLRSKLTELYNSVRKN